LTNSSTYLVVDLLRGAGEGNVLDEDISDLLQLLALRPVIESSGDINFLRWMFPTREEVSPRLWRLIVELQSAICHVDALQSSSYDLVRAQSSSQSRKVGLGSCKRRMRNEGSGVLYVPFEDKATHDCDFEVI
jgi:hypothetical protein